MSPPKSEHPRASQGQPSVPGEPFPQEKKQRLFFALWPDKALRAQLVRRSKSLMKAARGRPVPADNLHITLAFLGRVDARQRQCLEAMADAIRCPPFELTLDCAGHWSRSRVLWWAPSVCPDVLSLLAAALHTGATECGLSLDDRPYRPHLSLMRKVSRGPDAMAVDPLRWAASHFALVRSVPIPEGVRYQVLREWPLAGGAVDRSVVGISEKETGD